MHHKNEIKYVKRMGKEELISGRHFNHSKVMVRETTRRSDILIIISRLGTLLNKQHQ